MSHLAFERMEEGAAGGACRRRHDGRCRGTEKNHPCVQLRARNVFLTSPKRSGLYAVRAVLAAKRVLCYSLQPNRSGLYAQWTARFGNKEEFC